VILTRLGCARDHTTPRSGGTADDHPRRGAHRQGNFIARPTFNDVPTNLPLLRAISQLGARTIAQDFTQKGGYVA